MSLRNLVQTEVCDLKWSGKFGQHARCLIPRFDGAILSQEWKEGVIPPFLTGCGRRTHAAIFSFMAGVMPPMPMLGRSLL